MFSHLYHQLHMKITLPNNITLSVWNITSIFFLSALLWIFCCIFSSKDITWLLVSSIQLDEEAIEDDTSSLLWWPFQFLVGEFGINLCSCPNSLLAYQIWIGLYQHLECYTAVIYATWLCVFISEKIVHKISLLKCCPHDMAILTFSGPENILFFFSRP